MIIDKFEGRVKIDPAKIAIKFGVTTITYGELNAFANRLARVILSRCPVQEQGDDGQINTVGLLLEHGHQQVVGLLAVLKARMTYVPLDGTYPEKRLVKLIAGVGMRMMLVGEENMPLAEKLCAAVRETGGSAIRLIPVAEGHNPDISPANLNWQDPDPGDRPAYILHTSGSSGESRGVVQTCENVCYYAESCIRLLSITLDDRLSYISSFVHDGAVPDIYGALLSGAVLCPLDLRASFGVTTVGKFLIDERITIYHSVPTVFRYAAATLEEQMEFPHLRFIMTGGEKLQVNDVLLARKWFPGVIMGNIYGQTESTVNSIGFIDPARDIERITIGDPLEGVGLMVLNERGEQVEPYEIGEIFVVCSHLAVGYWRDSEATARAFLYDEELGRVYRTGDLGKLGVDGSIEFVGRKDRQVKIRGFRVELQEIEGLLLAHEQIKEAVVVLKENRSGEEYLCAYIVPIAPGDGVSWESGRPGVMALRAYLEKQLPDYMIPAQFRFLEKMPRTTTGKVDPKALPEPEITTDEVFNPPQDSFQDRLVKIWSEVLKVPRETISIDANFFNLGGHSLKATMLISKIQKEFNVDISLAEVFKTPFIRDIARVIRNAEQTNFIELERAEEREYFPLSYNQQRLYILHQLNPESSAYNMSKRFLLNEEVDETIVKEALKTLVERHASLRTGFRTVNHETVQYVVETIDLPFQVVDTSAMPEEGKQRRWEEVSIDLASVPFDLENVPLFRAVLVRLGSRQYDFMFSIHHIISDGWSLEILQKEFLHVYGEYSLGKPVGLAPLPFQYTDFSWWHNRQLEYSVNGKNPAAEFWKQKLAGGIPTLQLPVDFTEGSESPAGAGYRCMIGEDLKQRLNRLAEQYHTTLFTVMFSVYLLVLSRISGQEDIGCSVIAAGREHISLHDIVGLFVNSILFNVHIDIDEAFERFVKRVNDDVMQGLRYQAYPMEPVFEALNMRFPEVSVSFNMLNMQDITGGQPVESFEASHVDAVQDVKFDLEPYITEYENGIRMWWVYRKSLFEPAAIEYIIDLYIKLLEFFARDSSRSLRDHIEEEKRQKTRRFARRQHPVLR
jgi:amino acid adenylation domain-containing protein